MTAKTKNATAKVEEFAAEAQKAATEQFEKATQSFEGASEFGQQNVDSLVKSSEIAGKAAETIGEEVVSYSKKSFEDTVAAAQDFTSAKTANELFEKQSAFMTSAFEGFVAQATKMNDIYASAAKDIAEPINERVTTASETFKSFAA